MRALRRGATFVGPGRNKALMRGARHGCCCIFGGVWQAGGANVVDTLGTTVGNTKRSTEVRAEQSAKPGAAVPSAAAGTAKLVSAAASIVAVDILLLLYARILVGAADFPSSAAAVSRPACLPSTTVRARGGETAAALRARAGCSSGCGRTR